MALKGKISDYQEFVAELNANLDEWLKTPRGEWEAFAVRGKQQLINQKSKSSCFKKWFMYVGSHKRTLIHKHLTFGPQIIGY